MKDILSGLLAIFSLGAVFLGLLITFSLPAIILVFLLGLLIK